MSDQETTRVPHREIGRAAIVIGTVVFTIGYISNSISHGIVGLESVGVGLAVLAAVWVTNR